MHTDGDAPSDKAPCGRPCSVKTSPDCTTRGSESQLKTDTANTRIKQLEEENLRLRTLLAQSLLAQKTKGEILPPTESRLTNHTRESTNLPEGFEQQVLLFDTVLSSIVDFVYVLDREGRFTYVNRALLDLWQAERKDVLGKTHSELNYPADLAALLHRQVETVFRTGQVLRDEAVYTDVVGTTRQYEYIFAPVFDRNGAVEIIVGSTRDISERYVIEEELRDTRSRLQATLNAGVVATWTWNVQANTVFADQNLALLLSVSPEDAAGGPIAAYLQAIYPEDLSHVEAAIQTALENGSYDVECRIVLPDGSIRYVIARGKVEYDSQGAPLNMRGVVLDITERKEAEDALLLFRTVLENTDDFIGMMSLEGLPFYANPAALRLVGLDSIEQMQQTRIQDYFFPEDQSFIMDDFIPRVVRDGHAEVEIRFRNFQTGEPCWMIYSLFTVTNTKGEPVGTATISRDIDERKQMEETLRAREQFIQSIVDASPGIVYVFDIEARHTVFINGQVETILGMTPKEVLAAGDRFLTERVHPDDLPRLLNHFTLLMGDRREQSVEYRMLSNEGNWLWFLSNDTVFEWTPDGRPRQILGVASDITVRKRIEEELAETEQKFRLVTDMMPQLVWSTLPDGFHDYYNARWFEYTGLTFEDTRGEKWNHVLHPDDQARAWELWQRSLDTGEPYVIEYRFKRFDGTYHWFIARAVPLHDAEGRIVRWFGTCTDLDDQKSTEDALRRQREEIEALNARLKRSMTETHHRVKNNLQMISSLIDMQRATGAATVPMKELIRLSANVVALGVIHDILTQEAKVGNDQETLSIRVVLEKLMKVLKQTIGERSLSTAFDEMRLTGSQVTTLALVVNELVSNAFKHGRGMIEVCFRIEGDTATLEVCDDGPGFSEDFDAAAAGSTGLELVENIVRWDLRGRIVYTNRAEGGAKISIAFPHTPEDTD